MTKILNIAVDAMGGESSPKKSIDGIIHHSKSSKNINQISHSHPQQYIYKNNLTYYDYNINDYYFYSRIPSNST